MRTPEKDLALLYFENQSELPAITGFIPNTSYALYWFETIHGEWKNPIQIKTDKKGKLVLPEFPDGQNPSATDWALKIKEIQ
jgi:hypothetical protein